MQYQPVEFDDTVNVTQHNPLVEFFSYMAAACAFIAFIYIGSAYLIDWAVERTTPEMEEWLNNKISFTNRFLTQHELSPELQARQKKLQALFDTLPKDHMPPNFTYEVFLADEKEINAYALPAGKIVINRGLLDSLKSENALVFVLGHELGHIKNRDHLRGLGRGLVAGTFSLMLFGEQSGVSSWISREVLTIDNTFSREQERRADRAGLEMLMKYYGHAGGAMEFFKRVSNVSGTVWMSYLTTHPHPIQRMKILRRIMGEKNYSEKETRPLAF